MGKGPDFLKNLNQKWPLIVTMFVLWACGGEAQSSYVDPEPLLSTHTSTTTPLPTETPTPMPTNTIYPSETPSPTPFPTLPPEFLSKLVKSYEAGNPDIVTGMYIQSAMGEYGYFVAQQPIDNYGYVSSNKDTYTQLWSATDRGGTYGLVAHNYLEGAALLGLGMDDTVSLVLQNGGVKRFKVVGMDAYRVDPADNSKNEPTTYYQIDIGLDGSENGAHDGLPDGDWSDTGIVVDGTEQLFIKIYEGKYFLVGQTCLADPEDPDNTIWGRAFYQFEPLAETP